MGKEKREKVEMKIDLRLESNSKKEMKSQQFSLSFSTFSFSFLTLSLSLCIFNSRFLSPIKTVLLIYISTTFKSKNESSTVIPFELVLISNEERSSNFHSYCFFFLTFHYHFFSISLSLSLSICLKKEMVMVKTTNLVQTVIMAIIITFHRFSCLSLSLFPPLNFILTLFSLLFPFEKKIDLKLRYYYRS